MKLDAIFEFIVGYVKSHLERGKGSLWERTRKSKAALTVLVIVIAIFQMRGLPDKLSKTILDSALIAGPKAEPARVRLVAINDNEYQNLFGGRSPLDPDTLGKALTAIWKGSPALIVVDVDTAHPMFRHFLAPRDARILWSVAADEVGAGKVSLQPVLAGDTMPAAWTSAVAAFPNDDRGIIRGYRRQFLDTSATIRASVPWSAAQMIRGADPTHVTLAPSDNERLLDFRYRFRAGGSGADDPLSLSFIVSHADQPGWPQGLLHNKIVVLGGAYAAGRDVYATPVGILYGCQILAQAIEAEIDNTSIAPIRQWTVGLLQLVAGALIVIIHHRLKWRAAFFASLIVVPLLAVAGSLLLFHSVAGSLLILPVLAAVLITELYTEASLLLTPYQAIESGLSKEQPAALVQAKAAGSE